MDKIIIYADGGCRGNGKAENIGGYGAVLKYKDMTREVYGGEKNTTNNRMELMGCIKALESLKKPNIPIEVHMDSQYVYAGITEWIYGWIKKGWKNSQKKPVENKDLWVILLELKNKFEDISFYKCKGHSGDELNEVADQLCNKAMDELE